MDVNLYLQYYTLITCIHIDVPLLKKSSGDDTNDYVEFVQVAMALGKHMVKQKAEARGAKLEEIPDVILTRQNHKPLMSPAKNKGATVVDHTHGFNSAQLHASEVIQRAVRRRLEAKAKSPTPLSPTSLFDDPCM